MKNSMELTLQGLNCANCAGKIEEQIKRLNTVDEANLNFINKEVKIKIKGSSNKKDVYSQIVNIVKEIEPDVKVYDKDDVKEEEKDDFLKKSIIRFSFGTVFFITALFLKNKMDMLSLLSFIISYLFFGADVVIKAVRNILKGDLFDENFLMSIATIGAFYIGDYPEAVAVMLFYQIGEFFQDLAVDRSRKSIKNLMNIKPEYANLIIDNQNNIKVMNPEDINISDIILVKPGEKIPLDGYIIEGSSYIDMSALIGESVPRNFKSGDEVLSGAINQSGVLKVKVAKKYENSTVSKIFELVENAGSRKSSTESIIRKFAKIYTPIVVILALMLAVVPPMIIQGADFNVWLSRALVFLVSSCPCALVVSVPLSFFSGIGFASKNGILIKGSNYLQALSEIDTFVFDKTGTITKGIFEVSKINTNDISENELIKYAYSIEKFSNHPVAKSIVNYYEKKYGNEEYKINNFKEIGGFGISAFINGKEIIAGNNKLMNKENIKFKENDDIGTIVYIAYDSKYIGCIVVSDTVKDDSKEAVKKLKEQGIKQTIMLTGDRKSTAEKIADLIKIDKVYSELLPQDKVSYIEKIYSGSENKKIAFVGDGINDAPVLARADVGIAMGAIGSDAAIEAADVVIMTDELYKICDAVNISKKTISIVKQNVVFVLTVKFIVLALASIGFASMWLAVFADVGVALISILNSMRNK